MTEFHFPFNAKLRAEFRSGRLGQKWARRYPDLFDKQDLGLLTTDWQRRYHFLEWLGAILLYESTGYVSLSQKYTCTNHPRKVSLLREIVPNNVFEYLYVEDRPSPPDLFVFAPDHKDWFFCEIKRPTEKVSDSQIECQKRLAEMSQKLAVLRFHEVHGGAFRC